MNSQITHNITHIRTTHVFNIMLSLCCLRDSSLQDPVVENSGRLLRVQVIRGVNLAVRDMCRRSSDPYVILTLGHQKVKTRVLFQNCNPQWHEQLTLFPAKSDLTIYLAVFDHDTFSADDEMGEAEIDLKPYIKCVKELKKNMKKSLPQEGAVVSTVMPTNENCLAGESRIVWKEYRLVQEMRLLLKKVECGEIHIEVSLESVAQTQKARKLSSSTRLVD